MVKLEVYMYGEVLMESELLCDEEEAKEYFDKNYKREEIYTYKITTIC